MPFSLALQLYSVRAELAHDFAGVVRAIAAMGYTGVETAGFPGSTPAAAARLFHDLGLTVCSAHLPLPTAQNAGEIFGQLKLLDCSRAVIAWQPPERFADRKQIRRLCEELNAGARLAAQHGVTLFYHNHWWELRAVDGRPALVHMLDYLDPSVHLEIDTYWAQVGGVDPARLLRQLGPRAALLHVKDGPGDEKAPMVAVGQGIMDVAALLQAAEGNAQWLIVELDRCATDMLTAVSQSAHYLKRWIR